MISGCLCSPAMGCYILPVSEAAQNQLVTAETNSLQWPRGTPAVILDLNGKGLLLSDFFPARPGVLFVFNALLIDRQFTR